MRALIVLGLIGCGGSGPVDPGACTPESFLDVESPGIASIAVVACESADPTRNILNEEQEFSLPLEESGGEHRLFARFHDPIDAAAVRAFAGPCPLAGFTVCLPEGRLSSPIEANRLEPVVSLSDERTFFASIQAPTTTSQVMVEIDICESVPDLCAPGIWQTYTVRYDTPAHPEVDPLPGPEVCRCVEN